MSDSATLMLEMARKVRAHAYAPYSKFHVGSCIRTTNNNFYAGCNVENVSYGLTLCAEASAIAMMVAAGECKIAEVVVIGSGKVPCAPCGRCRQLLWEFSTEKTPVHLCDEDGIQMTMSLAELLPYAFGPQNLEKNK